MALNDRFHFIPRVIHVGVGLVGPMVEEDVEKRREGRGSVRAVTGPNAASFSWACTTEHWKGVSLCKIPQCRYTYGFLGRGLWPSRLLARGL